MDSLSSSRMSAMFTNNLVNNTKALASNANVNTEGNAFSQRDGISLSKVAIGNIRGNDGPGSSIAMYGAFVGPGGGCGIGEGFKDPGSIAMYGAFVGPGGGCGEEPVGPGGTMKYGVFPHFPEKPETPGMPINKYGVFPHFPENPDGPGMPAMKYGIFPSFPGIGQMPNIGSGIGSIEDFMKEGQSRAQKMFGHTGTSLSLDMSVFKAQQNLTQFFGDK